MFNTMNKKRKYGRVVANYNGILIRHTEEKGGRLALYKGKNKIGVSDYPNLEIAWLAAKVYFKTL